MHTDVVEGRYGRVDVLVATDDLIRLDKPFLDKPFGFHRRGLRPRAAMRWCNY
jgi:hypothetical protein